MPASVEVSLTVRAQRAGYQARCQRPLLLRLRSSVEVGKNGHGALLCCPQGGLASAIFAIFTATSPCRETTLLRKQVGEGASPRLDAGDRMAHALRSIKALVRRAMATSHRCACSGLSDR